MSESTELKQIAIDIRAGQIFTNWHIPDERADLLYSIFMPIGLLNAEQIDQILASNPGLIYEYMNKALPMGVDGYPCFGSVRVIDMENAKIVMDYITKLEEAEQSI